MPTETAEVPPDNKEATRVVIELAKTDSPTIDSRAQADLQHGVRLYLLKRKCPNTKYLDPIERRKRQRANDYRRTIEIFFEGAQDRTLHVWITFKKPVSYSEA